MIQKLDTCFRQVITPGCQVAYVTPSSLRGETICGQLSAHFTPGRLRVATVVEIIAISDGCAGGDGVYQLTLDNGDKINAEDCAVTDGKFEYAKHVMPSRKAGVPSRAEVYETLKARSLELQSKPEIDEN